MFLGRRLRGDPAAGLLLRAARALHLVEVVQLLRRPHGHRLRLGLLVHDGLTLPAV